MIANHRCGRLLLGLLVAVLTGAALGAPAPSVTLDKAAYEKVQALLKGRRDALREVLKAREAQFEAGRLSPPEMMDARRALLHAELDLATVPGRAAVNEALAKHVKEHEEYARAMFEAGRISPGEYAAARADCRAEEARLLRERAGPRPTEAQSAALRKLRRERLDFLRKALAEQEKTFEAGRAYLGAVSKAARLVFEAELLDRPADRVDACRRYAGRAQHWADLYEVAFEAGRVPRSHLDTALAEKLTAEAGLLRARGKLNPDETGQLQALQRDRRARWTEAFKGTMEAWTFRPGPFDMPVGISARLLEAELDQAKAPANRVEAHRAHLKRLGKIEELAKALLDAGRLTTPDYLNVKAARLGAEVAFVRAGGKPSELGK